MEPIGSNDAQLGRVEQYFGANAPDWQTLYAKPRGVNDVVLAHRRALGVSSLRELVPAGARILDAGCGAGLTSLDLLQRGFLVDGIDIAQRMLDLCERRCAHEGISADRYRFLRADASHSGLSHGAYAGILALGFLEYQEDEAKALAHFFDLLRPGGVLVVSGPARIRVSNYLAVPAHLRALLARARLAKPRAPLVRLGLHTYSFARFRQLVEGAGFDVLRRCGHGFAGFPGIAGRIPFRIELMIHRAFTWLGKILPIQQWGNDLIVVARKR